MAESVFLISIWVKSYDQKTTQNCHSRVNTTKILHEKKIFFYTCFIVLSDREFYAENYHELFMIEKWPKWPLIGQNLSFDPWSTRNSELINMQSKSSRYDIPIKSYGRKTQKKSHSPGYPCTIYGRSEKKSILRLSVKTTCFDTLSPKKLVWALKSLWFVGYGRFSEVKLTIFAIHW